MRAEPFIAVSDVPKASQWYQALLGCYSDMDPTHQHRREYDRLLNRRGDIVLQLHAWDAGTDQLDALMSGPDRGPHGHGVLLQFRVADVAAQFDRAKNCGAEIVAGIHDSPDGSRVFALRDPDGYAVVFASERTR